MLETKQRLGGVHFLINNAGIASDGALWRLSEEAWNEVLETNVTGAFNCIRAVAPIFRGAALRQDRERERAPGRAARVRGGQLRREQGRAAGPHPRRRGGARARQRQRERRRARVHPHRAHGDAAVRGHRAGAEELGARPGGRAGRRGPRDLASSAPSRPGTSRGRRSWWTGGCRWSRRPTPAYVPVDFPRHCPAAAASRFLIATGCSRSCSALPPRRASELPAAAAASPVRPWALWRARASRSCRSRWSSPIPRFESDTLFARYRDHRADAAPGPTRVIGEAL